jgi:hypothetical protein
MLHWPTLNPSRLKVPLSSGSSIKAVLFLGIVGYGVFLRAWDLGGKPFRVDEAESSINALTILRHGVPVDYYLGQPIFENTLTRPWPESEEYEFKDTSYSSRGVAVYHGWLPLYVLAGTYALAGIGPDQETTPSQVQHSAQEIRSRTVIGRVPGVLFGAAFLVALFAAAREWYGADAAWVALTAGAICEPAIFFARQARYYSATLALAACCGLFMGRMVFRGRWRDFLLGALVFALLFHTHTLSFLAAISVGGLTLPWLRRQAQVGFKLVAFIVLLAISIIPWTMLTGLTESARDIPRAWSLLSTNDLASFLSMLGVFPALAALTLVWLRAARWLRDRLPRRLTSPFGDHLGAFLFMTAWGIIGLVVFVAFVPAASFFYGRIVLTVLVPGLLFGAMLCTAAMRVVVPRWASALASILLGLAFVHAGQATFWGSKDPGTPLTYDLIESLRGLDLPPTTRVYASPNYHLTLTFYTGIPFQSTAPIRKSFFDSYPGEIFIVEAGPRYESLTAQEIQNTLTAAGYSISEAEAASWQRLLSTRLVREVLQRRVATVTPLLEPAPALLDVLLVAQRRKTEVAVRESVEKLGNPMFKDCSLPDYLTCWQTFYYRFVNPEERTGQNVNYADRIREARANVLPGEWVFYHCPPRNR